MEAFLKKVFAPSGYSGPPADAETARSVAAALGRAAGAAVDAESVAAAGGAIWAMARRGLEQSLLVVRPAGVRAPWPGALTGAGRAADLSGVRAEVLDVPRGPAAAAALRTALPFAAPQPIAGRPSVGMGDRLGLATPGHVRAVRGTGYVPNLAQQSIREMTRTGRAPQDVLDDATWGVFQTGFRDGFGADADHLKTAEAIDACAAAGFTFYTIDPGDHVDGAADAAGAAALEAKFEALPWAALETTAADTRRTYAVKKMKLAGRRAAAMDEPALVRAAAKYGRAIAHAAALHRHLAARLGRGKFELEVSVDETETPTSPAEHWYVAKELARLGVGWVSLAPRLVGRFEKGVDYLGDLEALERALADHLAIARALGDYKISLHSGSDKFSVYAIAARLGGRRVHVKTAGTSYLEALRVLAACEPGLFREILAFVRERYETDKATYHVSADLGKVPRPETLADRDLPAVLEQFDARQALHVTYGSVLGADGGARFRGRLMTALRKEEEAYAEVLAKHLGRHLAPFLNV